MSESYMIDMDKQDEDKHCSSSNEHSTISPGAMLRQARLDEDMSIKDVASRLRLSSTVIEALENDDYYKTPAPTFTRGYLRLYAREVGVNEDTIMALFSEICAKDTNPNEVAMVSSVNSITQKSLPVRERHLHWVTALIASLLLLLMVMWWHHHEINNDELLIQNANVHQANPDKSAVANSKASNKKV